MDSQTHGFYRWVEVEDGRAAECECGWLSVAGPPDTRMLFEYQMQELGEHVMEFWA